MGARNLRLTVLLTALLAAAGPAEAVVADAGATPERSSVAATGSAGLRVDWTVERVTIDPPKPGRIFSSGLRILIGGAAVANLPQALSQDLPGDTSSETVRFSETVQISRALIQRAVRQRSPLVVLRRFVDSADSSFKEATFEVVPSGPGSTALAVQRLALTFDDGSRTRVLPKGGRLRAVAEINSSGNGLLTGVWEAAFGAGAEAPLTFQPLTQVRHGVAGSGRTELTSPPLPTGFEGSAFVRFRITDPHFAFAAPTLQYYVTAAPPDESAAVGAEILLSGPPPGTSLSAETLFAWQAVAEAAVYRLVFRDAADGAAARATQILQAGQTETALDDVTLARLPAGRSYLWQVLAFDAKGAVIGSSSQRQIRRP